MRLLGGTVGIALSVLLSFSSGALLFLYWQSSSQIELLRSENKQLKRDLSTAHNDHRSGEYHLRLARSDLDEAKRSMDHLQANFSVQHSELSRMRTELSSTKKELAELKKDAEQTKLEVSNLRVNKEEMYKELDGVRDKLHECDDERDKMKKDMLFSKNKQAVHYSPGNSVNSRQAGMLQPDDGNRRRVANPYNSQRQLPEELLDDRQPRLIQHEGQEKIPKTILYRKNLEKNQKTSQLNQVNSRVDQVNPHGDQVNPRVDQVNPRVEQFQSRIDWEPFQADQVAPRDRVPQVDTHDRPLANHHVDRYAYHSKSQRDREQLKVDQANPQVDHANPQVDEIMAQVNERL